MKMNLRFINRNNYAKLGTIGFAILAILNLISLVINVVMSKMAGSNINFISLASSIINVIFYLLIANYFRKSESNFYFVFYALLIFLICDYIIPYIFQIIEGLFSLNLLYAIFPSLMIIIAVVFFIFMCIENRKREKKYLTILKIVSLCGGIFGLAYGIYNLVMELYPVIILLSAGESDLVTNLLPIIFVSLSAIVEMIIVPLVIIFYPFVLEKERYY